MSSGCVVLMQKRASLRPNPKSNRIGAGPLSQGLSGSGPSSVIVSWGRKPTSLRLWAMIIVGRSYLLSQNG